MKVTFDNLFMDFGHVNLKKKGETLSGDFYTILEDKAETTVVLSDGLGSGVKANILATLTSKILSTMMSKKLPIEEAVFTMANTLPVCSVRNLAYSTFTVLRMDEDEAYLAQYDNPNAILLRNGTSVAYPETIKIIADKEVRESYIRLQCGDMLIVMTDGVTNAGMGKTTGGGWGRDNAAAFCQRFYEPGMSAQKMAAHIAGACVSLNLEETDDDITILVFRICPRKVANVMIGPPKDQENDERTLRLFFAKNGKTIICGGTTARFVAKYLRREIKSLSDTATEDIPAMSSIEGVDLVTEGYLTLKRLVSYAQLYLEDEQASLYIERQKDAAARLAEVLFEEASDINIFFGKAVNAGHKVLNIDAEEKRNLIKKLEDCLVRMGKNVKISLC